MTSQPPIASIRRPSLPPWAQASLRVFHTVVPKMTAMAAERLVLTSPRFHRSSEELEVLSAGESFQLLSSEGRLSLWRWGNGPVILLLHGWGGRGSQLYAFVEPLTRAGFSVIAMDAPGHGDSEGRSSSLPQFARALKEVAKAVGPLHGVIAHSMGACATGLAQGMGLELSAWVSIGAPTDPWGMFTEYKQEIGLPSSLVEGVGQRIQTRLDFSSSEFHAQSWGPRLKSQTLIIHDRDDREIPFKNLEELRVAIPQAQIFESSGLGHRRILKDPTIVARTLRFLSLVVPKRNGENGDRFVGQNAEIMLEPG